MNILLIAYACEPNKGSEPGVGWNWVLQLAKHMNVTVLTRANNRLVIEAAIKNGVYPNLQFIYFDIPFIRKLKKKIPFGTQIYFLLWEYFSYRKIKNLKPDIIHRLTFVSSVSAIRSSKLKQPYIFGFAAGGENTPAAILKFYSPKYRIVEYVRKMYNSLYKYLPMIRNSINHSIAAIAVTEDSKNLLVNSGYKKPIYILPAIGIEQELIEEPSATKLKNNFTIVYAGRLIYGKNVDIILKALTKINASNLIFNIFGDGKEKKKLKKMCEHLKNKVEVNFKGWFPRNRMLEELRTSHLFVFPSSHDSGGLVLLEALALNIPVLFLNTGGPKEIFRNENYPLKINPSQSYESIVRDFAEKIDWVNCNYESFMIEFQPIRKRILEKYVWENKVLEMLKIYNEIIN